MVFVGVNFSICSKVKLNLPSGISCMLRPSWIREASGCLALHCFGPVEASPQVTVIWAGSDSILSDVART